MPRRAKERPDRRRGPRSAKPPRPTHQELLDYLASHTKKDARERWLASPRTIGRWVADAEAATMPADAPPAQEPTHAELLTPAPGLPPVDVAPPRSPAPAKERRAAARKLMEGICYSMGADLEIEEPLNGVLTGLSLVEDGDEEQEVLGYLVALQAMLNAPEALTAAIRLLYRDVLDTAPMLKAGLDVLNVPLPE